MGKGIEEGENKASPKTVSLTWFFTHLEGETGMDQHGMILDKSHKNLCFHGIQIQTSVGLAL